MAEEQQEEWTEVPIEEQEAVPVDVSMDDIVEVVDDDESEPQAEAKVEAEAQPKSDTRYQKRINQLTAQRHEEERRRTEIETENYALRERLDRLEHGADQQQLSSFKAEYDRVKEELETAAEEGDTKKQIAYTEKMADMRAAARVVDQQRAQYQAQQPVQAPAQPAPEQEAPPQEALRWWNKNRWFNSPDHTNQSSRAREIDTQLDVEGWDKENPDYYDELDSRLQKEFPELYSVPKKSKPPIAPTRGRAGGKGSKHPKDGRLRFTKAQLDMAKSLGITDEVGLRAYYAEIQQGEN